MKTFTDEHTHSEIHPSVMLSYVSLNIPFPEHSQYPRNASLVNKLNTRSDIFFSI